MQLQTPAFFIALLLFCSDSSAQTNTDTAIISLYSSAYLYPSADSANGIINENGLVSWSSNKAWVKVFFLCKKPGTIKVALKLKGSSVAGLVASLDNNHVGTTLTVPATAAYSILPAGSFVVKTVGYHAITIKATSPQVTELPAIESLQITGLATADIAFNKSEYRGAASVHLRYPVPGDSAVKWFYSEVMVPKEVEKSVNAYYETNGFNSGYMGIQINSSTERRFIFSIWSLYKTDDPKQVPTDYAVNLKRKGNRVFTGEFGDEGSGGHSHLVYPWQADKIYRSLTGIKSMAGDSTTYVGYFAAPADNYQWHLMSEWTQNKTDTKRGFRGLYSFVENFGDNGNDYFKAYYGNQWVCTPSGNWIELTDAVFSTTASPQKHQRYDYGAGVEGNRFYMYSGGFKQTNNITAGDKIKRPANNKPPVINFVKLLSSNIQ